MRDTQRGTDHQIDDYARFRRTFPELERPALAGPRQACPRRGSPGATCCACCRVWGYYPGGTLEQIVLGAEGYYVIGLRDGRTGHGLVIDALDDAP